MIIDNLAGWVLIELEMIKLAIVGDWWIIRHLQRRNVLRAKDGQSLIWPITDTCIRRMPTIRIRFNTCCTIIPDGVGTRPTAARVPLPAELEPEVHPVWRPRRPTKAFHPVEGACSKLAHPATWVTTERNISMIDSTKLMLMLTTGFICQIQSRVDRWFLIDQSVSIEGFSMF